LFDLARDAHGVYAHHDRIVFVGHAFGNRLARASSALYPAHSAGVILIGAGGQSPIPDAAAKALTACFDPRLPVARRTQAIRYGFFAADNEIPDYWLRGWHAKTARLQGGTRTNSPSEDWWHGGQAPILVIAGLQDTIAPPQDTIDVLERDFPDRVTGIRLDGAGHALLPEKPNEIADAVLTWLTDLPTQETET
jgi:pimeloyl-ACP methyl ester carboxylesterase